MEITIEPWDYHVRMLNDLATQNKAALLLVYDPDPKGLKNPTARAIIGDGGDFLVMMATIIDDIAKTSGIDAVWIAKKLYGMIEAAHEGEQP